MAYDKILIERDLLKSKAFRSLTATAMHVYFDSRMKCKIKKEKNRLDKRKPDYFILNNGELVYTCSGAESKGISRVTFMRTF